MGPESKPPALGEGNIQAYFLVISGLSGSGKSTALKALEDVGFYAVDNLPVELLPAFVNLPIKFVSDAFKAALVMDVRAAGLVESFPLIFDDLSLQGFNLELLFLEASDEALIRRFSETRRQHPLAVRGEGTTEGIARERAMMAAIRRLASRVLDTSRFTVHELSKQVRELYRTSPLQADRQVNLITFGFKFGLPQEADLVIDVRFLANPYFVPELKHLDGRDPKVAQYVLDQQTSRELLFRLKGLLEFIIPIYHGEEKNQVTIAIGCTGGRHRSVAVAAKLASELKSPHYRVNVRHRDIDMGKD